MRKEILYSVHEKVFEFIDITFNQHLQINLLHGSILE